MDAEGGAAGGENFRRGIKCRLVLWGNVVDDVELLAGGVTAAKGASELRRELFTVTGSLRNAHGLGRSGLQRCRLQQQRHGTIL